jgi:hypothetical protein
MKQKITNPQRIKVRLDEKTTVLLNKTSSLKIWKVRYPLARIIN